MFPDVLCYCTGAASGSTEKVTENKQKTNRKQTEKETGKGRRKRMSRDKKRISAVIRQTDTPYLRMKIPVCHAAAESEESVWNYLI